MSASYTSIGWNPFKRRYDVTLVGAVASYLALFIALSFNPSQPVSFPIVLIRALGTCAIALLHIVLWIGPASRLWPRLLPLLYNRRHLGVTTFGVALAHATIVIIWYHGYGNLNPLLSLLTANTNYTSLTRFPFETLGLIALLVLFLMAATSHDFWLKTLSPRVWKSLHMGVYAAYALLILHVALGVLQSERHWFPAALLAAGLLITISLHLAAGLRESRRDTRGHSPDSGWIDTGPAAEIPESRARVVCLRGRERVAIFRHDNQLSAISNICEHQMGPLGEGKVIDGCITCPWHGYQYRPGDGCSPPPFTEKVATYPLRISAGRVLLDPTPLPKGTPIPPAPIEPRE